MKLAVVDGLLQVVLFKLLIFLDKDIASDIKFNHNPNVKGQHPGFPDVGSLNVLSGMNDNLIDSVITVGSIAPREALFDRLSDSTLCFLILFLLARIVVQHLLGLQ